MGDKMDFLNPLQPDKFIEELSLSAYIFNNSEVRLSEVLVAFKIEKVTLDNKIKEMKELGLIEVEAIPKERDTKITATDELGFLFKILLEDAHYEGDSNHPKEISNNNKNKKSKRKKGDNALYAPTPKLTNFLGAIDYYVRSKMRLA